MITILGVVPYQGLETMLIEESKKYPEIHLTIEHGNMEKGLERAQHAFKQKKIDLIISRGGTAALLQSHFQIPVIDLRVTRYDIFNIIQSNRHFSGKKALIGFRSITDSADEVIEAMKEDISVFTLKTVDEIPILLNILKEQGFQMIFGDIKVTRYTDELQMKSVVITSSTESVQNAFVQSRLLFNALQDVSDTKNYFTNYLLKYERNFIVYDVINEKIILSPNVPGKDTLEKSINFHSLKTQRIKIEGNVYFIKKSNLEDRPFIRLFYIEKLLLDYSEYDGVYSKIISSKDFLMFQYYLRITEHERMEYLHSLGATKEPILIHGNHGTGKELAAQYIHLNSRYANGRFFSIDVSTMREGSFNKLLLGEDSILFHNGNTFFFKGVHLLSKNRLARLSSFLKLAGIYEKNKIIFSFERDGTRSSQSLGLIREVFEPLTSILNFQLLNFSEHLDHLSNLTMVYINHLNSHEGKSLKGVSEDAIRHLRTYSWPGNYNEYQRIIKELYYMAEGSYLDLNLVSCYFETNKLEVTEDKDAHFSITFHEDDTLEEMNGKIIRYMLEKNKNKKALTSQKLGISRSTLYRSMTRAEK